MPQTVLMPVPLAPEISLHLADRELGLFDLTGGEFRSDEPPPFWAFVWAGGQALARYVLDHPGTVRGRRVLDVATGCGVAAIAAARAGASQVHAVDLDPAAARAARRNAAANGVSVNARAGDADAGTGADAARGAGTTSSADAEPGAGAGTVADVILAGDVFYSPAVADRMTAALRRHARAGSRVLVGDPGRGYFPERLFTPVARYDVPVPAALEDAESLVTRVWEMRDTRR